MNSALKNVKTLMKSALPRTMPVIHEGCRINLQKRDYGLITETSWISAVSDCAWLSRKHACRSSFARLMHFIPNMDGSLGIPLQNDVNRFDDVTRSHRVSLSDVSEKLQHLMMANHCSDAIKRQKDIHNAITVKGYQANVSSDKSTRDNLNQTDYEKGDTTPIGVDDEALCFSANFVLVAFTFLLVVCSRDIYVNAEENWNS